MMEKIVVATKNIHKVEEIRAMWKDMPCELISLADLEQSIDEVIEDGNTFVANAEKKAKQIAKETGLPALADDSGLCVQALDGAPGVHSARYAGETKDDGLNRQKLIEALKTVPGGQRLAYFACAMSFALPSGEIVSVEGRCEGHIAFEEKGTHGFGYDSVFLSPDYDKTLAEVTSEEKNAISHRSRALEAMRPYIIKYLKKI